MEAEEDFFIVAVVVEEVEGDGMEIVTDEAEVEDMEEDAEEVGSTRELVGGNETTILLTTTLKYWGNHRRHPSILLLKVVATANSI